MKKRNFKHFVTVVLTSMIFAVNAGTGNNVNLKPGESEKTIQQQFLFPNIILPVEKNEKVPVVFTLNKENKIDVIIAKTENNVLKREIENQLADLTLPNLKANSTYSIVLNFKRY